MTQKSFLFIRVCVVSPDGPTRVFPLGPQTLQCDSAMNIKLEDSLTSIFQIKSVSRVSLHYTFS